jgi:hypothetical protein
MASNGPVPKLLVLRTADILQANGLGFLLEVPVRGS